MQKYCKKCDKIKPLDQFGKDRCKKDKHQAYCKICRAEQSRHRYLAFTEAETKKQKEYMRQYYIDNKEKMIENARRWRRSNREKANESNRRWQAANSDKVKEYLQHWQAANSDKVKNYNRKSRARKLNAPGKGFTEAEFSKLCDQAYWRCLCCGRVLPLAADHIIPLSQGGLDEIDNIQPLCTLCNSNKGTQTIDYRL